MAGGDVVEDYFTIERVDVGALWPTGDVGPVKVSKESRRLSQKQEPDDGIGRNACLLPAGYRAGCDKPDDAPNDEESDLPKRIKVSLIN